MKVLWPEHGPIFLLAPAVEVCIGDHPDDTAEWKGPIVGNKGATCVLELGAGDAGVAQTDLTSRRGAGKVLSCVELVGHGDAWHWDSVAGSEFI